MLEQLRGNHLRRRIGLMLQNTVLISTSAGLLALGLIGVVFFMTTQPTTLSIAVGPPGSNDVRVVQALAQYLAREKAPVRLKPLVHAGPIESAAALETRKVDLAVVRHDRGMPKSGQAVVIFRKNVAVLFAPAEEKREAAGEDKTAAKQKDKKGASAKANASKKAKAQKGAAKKPADEAEGEGRSKAIEKIEDLVGRRLGVIGRTEANINLLNVILDQYQIPRDKISVVQFEVNDAAAAIRERKVDAVLAVGPVNSRITADAIAAASRDKEPPVFLPISAAEAIAERIPTYEAAEIPAGAFGGSPPRPEETVATISVSHYIVARRTLYDNTVGTLTKHILGARQSLAADLPGASKIEAPDTDRSAVVSVHPGAAAFVDGDEKTVFDRYGDLLYWGLMLCSFIGSAAAGVMSYSRVDQKERTVAMLERSLAILREARSATDPTALEQLRDEIDGILSSIIRDADAVGLSESTLASFAMAADRAQAAIAERRAELLAAPAPLRRTGIV